MNKFINICIVFMLICIVATFILMAISAFLEFSSGSIVNGIGSLGLSCMHLGVLVYITVCFLLEKIKNRGR